MKQHVPTLSVAVRHLIAWFVIALAAIAIVAGAAVTAGIGSPGDRTDTANETEFEWGTVTTERLPDTDAITVNLTVESDGAASVSAVSAPNATERMRATDGDAEREAFDWGVVSHETDPDTGAVDVTVIVDAGDDVSLSVTTVGENGALSQSRTVIAAAGEHGTDGQDGADGEAGADGEPGADGAAGSATTNVTIGQSTTETDIAESADSIDIDGVSVGVVVDEEDE